MTQPRIGWIGAGMMGEAMCKHLLNAGYTNVTVTNRTLEKCESLKSFGAKVVSTTQEVANASDIVFLMVGFPSEVREIVLSASGLLSKMSSNSIIVDMSTNAPALAIEMSSAALPYGIQMIDAPVSGSSEKAIAGTLSIMVGGEEGAIKRVSPMLNVMGNFKVLGKPGAGQQTKMANQICITSNLLGTVESLLYASKCGLDLENVLSVISNGAAGSWVNSNLGPAIVSRDFDRGGMAQYLLKDMEIALSEASKMNITLPGLSVAHQLFIKLKSEGYEKKGITVLTKVLEEINALKEVETYRP